MNGFELNWGINAMESLVSPADEAGHGVDRDILELEKRYALAMLASDAAHDLANPINLFAQLIQRMQQGERLTERDLIAAGSQVERCRSLVAGLRRLDMPSLVIQPVRLVPLLENVVLRAGCVLAPRLDVPSTLTVMSDLPSLRLLLSLLLRTSGVPGSSDELAHISATTTDLGVRVTVARDAPISPGYFERPWNAASTATNLDTAIADVIARRLGWELTVESESAHERVHLSIPAQEDIRD